MKIEFKTQRQALAYYAIQNNQLLKLMRGSGAYHYEDKNFGGPVNCFEVLYLLYFLDEKDNSLNIKELFKDALMELIESDNDDLYLAILYFVYHCMKETIQVSSFVLTDDFKEKYLSLLRNKVHKEENNLKNELTIFGLNKWTAINNSNRRLIKETNFKEGFI
jgi:hypothetical protein